MYFDKRSRGRFWILAIPALVLIIGIAAVRFDRGTSGDMQAEAEFAIGEAVRRSALQCFAVEGVYPESLDYMVQNYGLRVNTEDYYVVYEVFADNLPPNIRVAKKEG